jgi:hypothetical protein
VLFLFPPFLTGRHPVERNVIDRRARELPGPPGDLLVAPAGLLGPLGLGVAHGVEQALQSGLAPVGPVVKAGLSGQPAKLGQIVL